MRLWTGVEWLDIGGRRVVTSAAMWDGEVALTPDALVVGVGEIPTREQARRDAVRLVQQGMADVLAWLGWPAWRPPVTSEVILTQIGGWRGP